MALQRAKNSIIAARGLRRRVEQVQQANRVNEHIEALTNRVFRRILWAAQFMRPINRLIRYVQYEVTLLDALPAQLAEFMFKGAETAYDAAADDIVHVAPFKPTAKTKEANSSVLVRSLLDAHALRAATTGVSKKQAQDQLIKSILFPPLLPATVNSIVYGNGWFNRLTSLTKLASPQAVAAAVTSVTQAGGGVNQLRQTLTPILGGVKSSAKRVARTEYLRVTQHAQNEAYLEVDDMIVGYQVHAVLDGRTRPWHRQRDGYLYFKQPKSGQRGMDQCPNPPIEEDGSVAHNCRCYRTPLFADDLALGQLGKTPHIDPVEAATWFDKADPEQQKIAIGEERHQVASQLLGRAPRWYDLIDAYGRLLGKNALLDRFSTLLPF